jgi:hypothetical protein
MAEYRDAMFICRLVVRLFGMQESFARMLLGLPGPLVSGLVVLLAGVLGGGAVCVSRRIMQLGRPLMIFVVGTIVVSSGHQSFSIWPDLLWAIFASS